MSLTEIRAITSESSPSPHLETLRKAAQEDNEYQKLRHFILDGFPDHRSQLPDPCKCYWNVCEHLTLDDDLIVNGCRPLIPTKMRKQVLSQLHEAHQGSVRTKQRTHLSVYWPGIKNDIDNTILLRSPLFRNPHQNGQFKKLLLIFAHMLVVLT